MSRTFGEVKTDLYSALGRNDSVAVSVANFAINYAIQIVSAIYDVGEVRQLGELTFSVGEDELLVADTARLNDVIKARNTTDDVEMGFISIEMLDSVVPTTGKPKFYSRDGDAILIRPTPAVETVVLLRYTMFPEWVTQDGDDLPLEVYEPQIVSIALAIAWSSFEEVDSAQLWAKIAEISGVSYTKAMQARKILEGRPEIKEVALLEGK